MLARIGGQVEGNKRPFCAIFQIPFPDNYIQWMDESMASTISNTCQIIADDEVRGRSTHRKVGTFLHRHVHVQVVEVKGVEKVLHVRQETLPPLVMLNRLFDGFSLC